MIKEWATVMSWHQGRALLRYGSSSGCSSCSARAACGSYALSKIGPNIEHQLEVEIAQPLFLGQKVEVGIPEESLLRFAMLVYLTPLFGLFFAAGLAQFADLGQLLVAILGILGGFLGFFLARKIASYWRDETEFQPVILQIGLPPGELSIQMN